MVGEGGDILKILLYLVLFCLSFLIFESISVIAAVGIALFALYYFTSERSSSGWF